MRISKIISGGQSGVDRAALDAAIKCLLPYGGYCPLGGWAEDMPDPPGLLADYPKLMETFSRDPSERTALNVRYSDATLILLLASQDNLGTSIGTRFTLEIAKKYHKPNLIIDLTQNHREQILFNWLASQAKPLCLNIAGPRESESPGIYKNSYRFLTALFSCIDTSNESQ